MGVGEGQGLLAVIRRAMAETLGVLVGGELAPFQDAVQVVPRSDVRKRKCETAPVSRRKLTSSRAPDGARAEAGRPSAQTCWKTSFPSRPRRACGPARPPAAQSGLRWAQRASWPPSPLPAVAPRRRTARAPESRCLSSTRREAWTRPPWRRPRPRRARLPQTGDGDRTVGDRHETTRRLL